MAQQFVMGRGALDLTIKSEKKTFEYQLEFETVNDSHDKDINDIDRIGITWINDNLRSCELINPADTEALQVPYVANKKIWNMSLAGKVGICEPTPVNLSKELFLAMASLFETHGGLKISRVLLHLGSSYIVCTKEAIAAEEAQKWLGLHYDTLRNYVAEKNTPESNLQ